MQKFEEMKFNIPELKGISRKNIEEHLKLYAGYVKNANLILSMLEMYGEVDAEDGKYSVAEISRRFSFEFNGMRNHEYYFSYFEGGSAPLTLSGALYKEIEKQFGSFDKWLASFKRLAMTRGVGWAVLGWDYDNKKFVHIWVDEQHLGQLNGVCWILAIDMWEHAYVYDYATSEKKNYVEAFFENLNWSVAEGYFSELQ